MPLLSPAEVAAAGADNPHTFARTLAANQPIGLRLYRRDGTPLGSANLSPRSSRAGARTRISCRPVRAQRNLDRDRRPGPPVGARSRPTGRRGLLLALPRSRLDTRRCRDAHRLHRAAGRDPHAMRWRIGWLLGAWLALIAGVAIFVQWTVRRSAARLEEELRAAAAGGTAGARRARSPLPLDPVAAEVHRGLRELLSRQRQREADVAVRLAHVDQLASLGQLAAGLAHEIKNPLAGIQGALEVLRDDSERRRDCAHLRGDARRVEARQRHPLPPARIGASGAPAPRPHRSRRLLEETSELLRPSLRRQRVELVTEAAAGLPALADRSGEDPPGAGQPDPERRRGDRSPRRSGGRITVRASGFPAEAAVVVAVEDNGPGIPPTSWRASSSRSSPPSSPARDWVSRSRRVWSSSTAAEIEVTSEPGKGTVVPGHSSRARTEESPGRSRGSDSRDGSPPSDSAKMAH
jgi:signal transduction histidine kinase